MGFPIFLLIAEAQMTEEDRFLGLAHEHFEAGYSAMPVQATTLGVHKYDNTLGDYSRSTIAESLAGLKDRQARLKTINQSALTPADRIDCSLLASDIALNILWYDKVAEWKRNPNFYAETPVYGIFLLLIREFAPLKDRMRSVLARLKDVPELLQAGRDNLVNPPRVFTEVAIETIEGGIQFFDTTVPELAADVPELRSDVLSANDRARAAYKDFLEYLKRDLLPTSTGDFAIGKQLFEERLRTEHMLSESALELGKLGRRTFAAIEKQMEVLARDIDPSKTWPELIAIGRNEFPSGEQLLDVYRNELSRLRSFIVERDLVTIPANERLEIVDTPLFARSTLPYAAYNPPAPFEPDQKGQFWVTPLDTSAQKEQQIEQMKEHCHYAFPIIALHEAYPGHHVQMVSSNNISSYVRKHISSNTMCEGWALYCEQLLSELGYEPSFIASMSESRNKSKKMQLFHLFVLKDALWRAARVIIDVGLHTQGMTFDEGVQLLTDRVYLSKAAAVAEVRRYAMSPTQPMSYMLGKLQILALRDKLKQLPLRQFHDYLLSSGTIPLSLVEKAVHAKIS